MLVLGRYVGQTLVVGKMLVRLEEIAGKAAVLNINALPDLVVLETDETITIGNVTIMVVRVSRDDVRLGIKAPKEVQVVRCEARDKTQRVER